MPCIDYGAARWCLLQIPYMPDRPARDAAGIAALTQPLAPRAPAPGAPVVPPVLLHWADVPLARAYAARLEALVQDTARVRALDATPAWGDPAAVRRQAEAQEQYVQELRSTLASFYNACNVPWHTDPAARALYRTYVAGPPTGAPSNTEAMARAQFAAGYSYNESWFRTNDPWPVQGGAGTFGLYPYAGIIPADAAALFYRYYPGGESEARAHAVEFVPTMGLTIAAVTATNAAGDGPPPNGTAGVMLADTTRNVPWRMNASNWERIGYPQLADPNAPSPIYDGWRGGVVVYAPDGRRVERDGPIDWRCVQFDEQGVTLFGRVKLRVGAPLRGYMLWLRQWVALCAGRTPEQVIYDARVNTMYCNARSIAVAAGSSAERLFNDVMLDESQRLAQAHAGGAAGDAIAAVTTTVAGIVGLVLTPFTGGIGAAAAALIGGAIAMGAKIISRVVNTPIEPTRGKDDLGRFKPIFERGWLAGNPGDLGGAPTFDPDTGAGLLAPPTFTRPPDPDPPTLPGESGGGGGGATCPPAPLTGLSAEAAAAWNLAHPTCLPAVPGPPAGGADDSTGLVLGVGVGLVGLLLLRAWQNRQAAR